MPNIEELDLATDDEIAPMQIVDCPNCGLVTTATGVCGYCGEHCND